MTSVFDLYGYGVPPYDGDSIDASTADVAALYDQKQRYGNSLFGRIDNWLRQKQSQPNKLDSDASLWDQAAEAGNRLAHLPVDMLLAGSRTANNWAGSPQFPERVEPGDMLAPLGIGAMAGLGGTLKGAALRGRMMPDTIPASYFDDIMPAAGAGRAATDLTVPQNRLVRAANDGDDGPLRGSYPSPGNLPLRPSEASSVSLTEAYERYAEKAFQRGLQPDSFERFREAVLDAGIVPRRQAGRSVLPGVELFADQSRASLPGILAGAVDERKGFTAYHGSPHDFDRFDMSKIGTGEGAQAYGHGLYFAENEGVARSYRDGMMGKGLRIEAPDGLPWSDEISAYAYRAASDGGVSPATAAKRAAWRFPELRDKDLKPLEDAIAKAQSSYKGRMYEVRINADPDLFLDYDLPLSKQSQSVQAKLKSALGDGVDKIEIRDVANGWQVFVNGEPASVPYGRKQDAEARVKAGVRKGQSEAIATDRVFDVARDPDLTSRLRDAGIPGIRYLDQGSRTAGEGSRNYVLFRDDIIEIVKKYGIAAAASMYGMSAVDEAMASEGP